MLLLGATALNSHALGTSVGVGIDMWSSRLDWRGGASESHRGVPVQWGTYSLTTLPRSRCRVGVDAESGEQAVDSAGRPDRSDPDC
jgi:hypothetical protein